jgi:RNA recognition motif-containing protein
VSILFVCSGLCNLLLGPSSQNYVLLNPSARQKLYIGNLSFYTVPETLRELFEEFGEVHDCYMPEDPETGGSRGFGFVTLDKEAAEAAIRATDGCELDDRIIRVNAAQPKGSFQNRKNSDGDWSDDDGYEP